MKIPVIDIAPLLTRAPERQAVAAEIGAACRDNGFFYISGHGVDTGLQDRLERLSREFFAEDEATKLRIRMELGGRAWRGYFPVGKELTSGRPDRKEGLYFGTELPPDHPKFDTPLHGANLFPDEPFRETVLAYMAALTEVGHALMSGIALSLELDENYFAERYTADPLILFRIFNYPPGGDDAWGVGEHTDYGLLTILKQDNNGGLQVKSKSAWIDADPIPGTFVCNIGDMLDRLTGGRYTSTAHRVVGARATDRMSWPFFFDPNFDADVGGSPYGDYILAKVAKVFPHLGA